MTRPARVHIDTVALCHNLEQVRHLAPRCAILAMVKANAYGHGLEKVALALNGADAFGVACIEEALRLRAVGITQPIVLMEGFFTAAELTLICQYQLDIMLHSHEQLNILERTKLPKPITVWLKINTGMNRLGFALEQVTTVWQRLQVCVWIKAKLYLATHFASADNIEKSSTLMQLTHFIEVTKNIPGKYCLANSAAILAWPETHGDWVRPGIMLYGVSPFTMKTGIDYGLKPVMTVSSEIIAIQNVAAGSTVGYGENGFCSTSLKIAVVAFGYGDGYPGSARAGTPVLVNGREVPLIGRVSMDMLTVDISSQPDAKVGDPVILWGNNLPVEIVAKQANTLSYELLCKITQRVKSVC